jgi:hypothetical protein
LKRVLNIVELFIYAAVLYVIVDPSRLEMVETYCRRHAAAIRLRVEALDTLAQIRSLPEK